MALRVASWNLGGLKRRCRKRDFVNLCQEFDILAFQETLVHRSTRQVSIPGFQFFRKDAIKPATGRPIGGLGIFVSFSLLNCFSVDLLPVENCSVESMLLKFSRLPSANPELPEEFFIFNVYVPPLPAGYDYHEFYDLIFPELLSHVGLSPFLFLGDFNCHAASRAPGFSFLQRSLSEDGFVCFPNRDSPVPTFVSHKGSSVIDFCFSRGFSSVPGECVIFPFEAFGHRVIRVKFLFPVLSSYPLSPRTSYRKRLDRPVDRSFFKAFRASHQIRGPLEVMSVGLSVVFSSLLAWLSSFLYEVRPPCLEDEPWMRYLSFGELKELRDLKSTVESASVSFRVGDDVSQLRAAHDAFFVRVGSLRTTAISRFVDATRASEGDPAALWKTIKNFRLDPAAAQGLPVDTLCKHFHQLFNRVNDAVSLPFMYEFSPVASELDARFTSAELDRVFSELRKDVAPGPSGIGNEVILALRELPGAQRFLLDLFNGCLLGGSIPEAWQKCEMFLLYKGKGDPLLPGSYRAIALLDCFLKVYERLLFHRLDSWARLRDLVPPSQFGFRPRSGTLDAVFVFVKLLEKFVFGKKGILFAALIDFKSAFPSVDRTLLFKKLAKLGVSARFGRALHSLFEDNTFMLRFESGVSEQFSVCSGLREGSVLSPLLFSIFISDMEGSVLRPFNAAKNFLYQDFRIYDIPIPGLLYADDLVIFARSQRGLKERLKRLEIYVAENKLTVNVSKSEVVVFGHPVGKFNFRFSGESLPVHASCKYLGVFFGARNGIEEHLSSLASRFVAASCSFFQLLRKLRASHLQLIYRLTSSLLLSSLYGVEFVRDPQTSRSLTLTFRKSLRSFLGVPTRVSNDFLSMIFPQLNFDLFIAKRKLGFLRRTLRPSDTLVSPFFLLDRLDDFPNGVGFSADLLSFLRPLGLQDLVNCDDKGVISRALAEAQEQELILAWERMRVAKSTSFLCTVFSSPGELHKALVAASTVSLAMVRIFVLMWTGSTAIHLFGAHERHCRLCAAPLDTRHFFGCGFDIRDHLQLIVAVRSERYLEVVRFTSNAFFVYLFRSKPVILSEEEALLAYNGDCGSSFSLLSYNTPI